MVDLRKEIGIKQIPLKEALGDKKYDNDIILSIGGFNVSAISLVMQDQLDKIQSKNNITYDEFCVLSKPFPWFRLLIPDIIINGILYPIPPPRQKFIMQISRPKYKKTTLNLLQMVREDDLENLRPLQWQNNVEKS